MSHLAITLFGGFQAELDGRTLTAFRTAKNRALLAYLALESKRPHRREVLATLLWPEHPESQARNSLRQALYQVHRLLAEGTGFETHLLITTEQVQFNPISDYWLDVHEFRHRLSACQQHHPAGSSLCPDCLESLQSAIELYQGEMLDGFSLQHCPGFTDWQIIHQETCHVQMLAALSLLAGHFETHLAYDQLIACSLREIELEPWRETAYQRLIWALAENGQRQEALRQYEILRNTLQHELGIVPTGRTRQLYEQIRGYPLSVQPGQFSAQAPTAPFVNRQRELTQLHSYLRDALAGDGRVAFVRGEAGSGKTALLYQFASQARLTHRDLFTAKGACSAYRGLGDPYQPFQEVLDSLSGMSHQLDAPTDARPNALETLVEPGQRSTAPTNSHSTSPAFDPSFLKQTGLFNQVDRLLLALSCRFPLLILIDDLQWIDSASASLLFHLGGHLAGGRVLLLGAYRPEDIAPARDGTRHPLVAVVNEFRRRFGEIEIDLSQADDRGFVNAYLDSQPNLFNPDFRDTLYRHTCGNPLFTVELLQAMRARGEVFQNKAGQWMVGTHVDWDQLPARVEAVIVERLGRLDTECLRLLEAASVQGEVFSATVLTRVLGVSEEAVTTRLSGPLCKQHRLVSSLGIGQQAGFSPACYQFRHLLYQKYLYQSLDEIERSRLQQATTDALKQMHAASEISR